MTDPIQVPSLVGEAPPSPSLFGEAPPTRNRLKRRIAAVAVLAVAAIVVFAVTGGAQPASTGYRTAAVSTESVDQLLDVVGTVVPVSQAAVAFPVAGTVADVDVKVGDAVASGDRLAGLETQDLQSALMQQNASLAQAQLALEKAVASHDAPAATSVSTSSGSTASGGSGASSQLADAQKKVTSAQKQSDAALATADAALAAATTACAAGPPPDPTTTTSTTVPAPTTTVPAGAPTSCLAALQATATAQAAASTAQHASSDAIAALNGITAGTTHTSGSGSGGTAASGPSSQGSGSQGSGSTSAAALLAAQREVDAAAAHVAVAQQALAQATIVSPIAGTVVAVDMAAGDSVTAGSATETIVVVGAGGYEINTTIGVDILPKISVGDDATIVPDGTTTSLPGSVVAIGLTPDSSGAYPVTVGLAGSDVSGLRNGSLASVSIVLKSAASALAVPTSAVHAANNRHTVTVRDGGSTKMVTVQVGAIGSTWTQITGGLTAGQEVVLADLGAPLPSSATAAANGTTNTTGLPAGLTFRGGGAGGGTGRTGGAGG
jgi:HlyD family secretion protein